MKHCEMHFCLFIECAWVSLFVSFPVWWRGDAMTRRHLSYSTVKQMHRESCRCVQVFNLLETDTTPRKGNGTVQTARLNNQFTFCWTSFPSEDQLDYSVIFSAGLCGRGTLPDSLRTTLPCQQCINTWVHPSHLFTSGFQLCLFSFP